MHRIPRPTARRTGSGLRRAVLTVLTLVLCTVTLPSAVGGVAGLGASSATAASPCAEFALFGARGTGEATGVGTPLEDLHLQFVQALGKGRTVRLVPVDYTAVSIEVMLAAEGTETYRASVVDGVVALRNQVQRMLYDCPTTRFVLAGYSQGAHVVTQFLDTMDLRGRVDAALSERIIGVSLFGSPRFTPGDGPVVNRSIFGRHAYNPNLRGLFWPNEDRRKPSVLSSRGWVSRTRSYCLAYDLICQFYAGKRVVDLAADSTHFQYGRIGPTRDAGRWLALQASLPRPALKPLFDITTTQLPAATAGKPYDASITVGGGVAPYRWRILSLPDGLSSRDGRITGTTRRVGLSRLTVTVTDRTGATVTRTLTLPVEGAVGSLVRITAGIEALPLEGDSYASSISDDGRWGAFVSSSANVVSPQCPGPCAVLSDNSTGETTVIPDSNGAFSTDLAISGDGSTVAFSSGSDPDHLDYTGSLSLYDRASRAVSVLTRPDGGNIETRGLGRLALSTDGRYLMFTAFDDVLGDRAVPDGQQQLWRYDRVGRTYELVSVTADGAPVSTLTFDSWFAPDGKRARFAADGVVWERDLVAGRSTARPERSEDDRWSHNGRWTARASGSTLSVMDESGTVVDVALPPQIVLGTCRRETSSSDDGTRFLIQTCAERISAGRYAGPLWFFDRTNGRTELVHPGGHMVHDYYRHAATPDMLRAMLSGRDLPDDAEDTNGKLDVYRWFGTG